MFRKSIDALIISPGFWNTSKFENLEISSLQDQTSFFLIIWSLVLVPYSMHFVSYESDFYSSKNIKINFKSSVYDFPFREM